MRYGLSASILALLVTTLPAAAEEKYLIRFRNAGVGETIRVEKEETRTTRTNVNDGIGRKLVGRVEKEVETLIYRETLLKSVADGGIGTMNRKYEKAQLKQDKSTKKYGFDGRTVVIRNDGKRFTFAYDTGQSLAAADAAMFDREFNGGDEKFRLGNLVPDKAVPVGADWNIDLAPLVKDFVRTGNYSVDRAWTKGTGHLVKASSSGGAQFGQLHYRMEIPIVSMAFNGPNRLPTLSGSQATFELSLDLCIDGTSPDGTFIAKSEVKGAADVLQPGGMSNRISVHHKSESREERKLEKQVGANGDEAKR